MPRQPKRPPTSTPDRPMPTAAEDSPTERRLRGQIRQAAVVMAGTMVLWMGASFMGGQLGWPPRFAFLIDLAAIAALVWSLMVTYFVWKARRGGRTSSGR